MKRIRLILTTLFLSLFYLQSAQAIIYISIEEFSPERKFPIAIADFVNQKTKQPDAEGAKIADILRRNIKLAGYFEIIPKSSYQDRGPAMKPGEINFEQWNATGAKVFVKGAYKKRGKKIKLELRLYDPQLGTMIVGKEYKVKSNRSYAAIHRFADEIMLALTGERGIFSTKIAAACGPRGKEEIVIMNVDGTERTAVTKNGSMNLSPTWSNDGSSLVYTSYMKRFPELYLSQGKGFQKWSSPKRLTFNSSLNITPDFSPNDDIIAFASSMDGDPDIHFVDRAGKKVGQLTKKFGIDISPSWSPDGQYLVFASERSGNLHLFASDRNGSKTKRLTFVGYQNDTPAWSPRGDKIAFIRRAGGGFNVFNMNADGSQQEQLTTSGNNENPSFSPDGRYITFSSSRAGGSNLYLMMWDGSNQTAITTSGDCRTPDWSPWLISEKGKK